MILLHDIDDSRITFSSIWHSFTESRHELVAGASRLKAEAVECGASSVTPPVVSSRQIEELRKVC